MIKYRNLEKLLFQIPETDPPPNRSPTGTGFDGWIDPERKNCHRQTKTEPSNWSLTPL
jgi:hypothetical protein